MSEKQNDVKSSRAIQFLKSLERPRPQQIKLAKASERATELGLNLIAEGPCGVGKSWAYLVPALLNGTQVVVVTATIALQNQIALDIKKTLAPMLGLSHIRVYKAKGMGNYLCKHKASLFEANEKDTARQRIKEWCKTTKTGDKSELVPLNSRIWKEVSTTHDECLGDQCDHRKECFAKGGLRAGKGGEYDVLILNYHMLLIVLKYGIFRLPETVILDEAHNFEAIARSVLGYEIRPGAFKCISDRVMKETKGKTDLCIEEPCFWFFDQLKDAATNRDSMYKSFKPSDYKDKKKVVKGMLDKLKVASKILANDEEEDGEIIASTPDSATETLRENMQDFMSCGSEDKYYYVEDKNKHTIPVARLFDVSDFLRKRLFTGMRSVQLFSATMPYNIADALGMPADNRARVSSKTPFDTSRVKIYIGNQKYDYEKEHEYIEYIVDLSTRCIKALGGRTLGLFASANRMRVARLEVQERVGDEYEILNTEDDKDAAARRFKEDPKVVLFGLKTFWEGFDAPGKTCCCVIIEKIPYESPTTPLATAGMDRLGKSEYAKKIMRPAAVTAIKQAIGRLQRVEADYGLVVIADPRARSMLQELGLSSRDLVNSLEEGIQHVHRFDNA